MSYSESRIRNIKIRIAGFSTLFFLLGFIISLIITIATSTVDENNKNVYSIWGMSINMAFAFLTVFCFILFCILLFLRFKKETNGPSLEMTPKETFKDNQEEGSLIETIATSKLPYSLLLRYTFDSFKKDLITLLVLMVLSFGLGLSFLLSHIQTGIAYALLILFVVTFLLSILFFLLPLFDKKANHIIDFSIYQDKIIYTDDRGNEDAIYFSSFFVAKETRKGFFFVFFKDGKQVFLINKEDLEKETKEFLSLKVKQVYNHNHRKIKK